MNKRIALALILGLGLTLGLLWLLGSQNSVALADLGILYVAPGGDCGGATPCYATVQAAVDAANAGDLIKVAQGTYSDIHTIPTLNTGAFTATQIVAITKEITLRGGHTTADWATADPTAHPSILDAQGQGRGLLISGAIAPTIGGLRITDGDAKGLGGGLEVGRGAGGGIYVNGTTAVISGNLVHGNSAYRGGGLWLEGSAAALNANTVVSNTADWAGGGLWLNDSAATLDGNSVLSNTALYGGGVILLGSNATLSGNTVIANAASGEGGGLSLLGSEAVLSGNTFAANIVNQEGGGLFLYDSDATLINCVVADNQAGYQGSGLYIRRSSPRLLHTTIARNSGYAGSGVYIADSYGYPSIVVMTNTILASHTVGIMVTAGNTATLNATLWHGNTTNWGGAGTINHSHDRGGDPALDTDGFHLRAVSAAIDRGVNAGVTSDIDGDARPRNEGVDLGADEFMGTPAARPRIYVPLAVRN